MRKNSLFCLFLFLFSFNCFGSELLLKYSVNATGKASDIKALSFGHQSSFLSFFQKKWEVGFWADQRPDAQNSGFGFMGIGVEPRAGSVYLNFFQSIGGIATKDAYLGGHFQFMEEVGMGVKDLDNGTSVGLFYRHISNAGIERPNKGKDFIGIQIGIPWF